MIVAAIMSPSVSPWLWTALALGGISAYFLMVPVNAILSAILPRKVNLSSIGRDSNAHQGANLLGFIGILLAAAPAGLATSAGIFWLDSARAAALLAAAWAAVSFGISWLALGPVARLVAARKENLLFVAQGR
jgi:MFS family permease